MGFRKACGQLIFCVSLFLATRSVQAAPVWVSTTVLPMIFSIYAFDMTTDDSGKLWTVYFGQNNRISVASTSESDWSSEFVFTYSHGFSRGVDKYKIVVDTLGIPHISFLDYSVFDYYHPYHAFKPSNTWEFHFFDNNPAESYVPNISVDASNVLHMSYTRFFYPNIEIVYATKSGAGWASEIAKTIGPGQVLDTSMDTASDGTPFLSYLSSVGDPVMVLTKKPVGWTDIQSFSGNWQYPTLKVDKTNHIHLVMTSTATNTPIARYILMDSSGTVQLDSSFALSELIGIHGPPQPSLAIDRENRAHIVVGSAYIVPPANPIYLQSNYQVDAPHPGEETKIVMVNGDDPYFLGRTPTDPILLTAHVNSPGSAEIVERTTHSLTWNFTPSGGSALGYRIIRVSDGVDLSGLLGPTATSFTQTGLSPNESQTLLVRAIFPGFSLDSAASAAHTLGVPPGDTKLNRVSGNTLAISWAPSGNVVGTLYRLHLDPVTGTGIAMETTIQSAQFQLLDPAIPYAVTLAAVGGDGVETFGSTLSQAVQVSAGAAFSFEISDGLGADILIRGTGSGPALAVTATAADSFPMAPSSFGTFKPSGIGFDIPTNQDVPSGQSVTLTLRYPEGRLNASDPLTLARYDPDRNQWIPLATQSDGANRRLTVSTRALGLFQVMVRTSRPADVGGARVSPNPFRPSLHSVMAIQEVPAGTHVRIYSDGGRLVREFTTSEGNATWDGRDGDGNLVHSGAYVLRLEQNGGTKRVRFVLER